MARNPVLAFDTHAAVVELTEAGMPERQAESVVRLQARLIEQHFATKADIAAVNSNIEASRLATESEFEKVHSTIESHRQATDAQFESHRQATDAQFESHRRATDAQFESHRQEFKADLASQKADLVRWMIATNLAFASLIIAAVKLL